MSHTVGRCAPWASLVVAPAMRLDLVGAASWLSGVCRGAAFRIGGRDAVAVAIVRASAEDAMRFLHHEIWHVVEWSLPDTVVALVSRETDHGLDYRRDEYRGHSLERRARAYSNYASLRDEGVRVRLGNEGQESATDIFAARYKGYYAGLRVYE